MIDLNDKNAIAVIDKSNAYSSVINLAKQCQQAWDDTQKIIFPTEYKNIDNIVLCGMGGSAYAALIIKALYADSLAVPFELVNGYNLPNYVNNKTLVLLSSYSGSTEEVLACAKEALNRKAKISGVCNGSKLAEFLKTNNLPGYIFEATHNPANQPRLGQGYMIFGHLGILAKIGFFKLDSDTAYEAIAFLEQENKESEELAKNIAPNLVGKIPVIVASEHLSGNAHVMRNQFNETAKNFAAYSLISELNHHLMEGLNNPKERILIFLFLQSNLYSPVIQKRFELTKEVIGKNNLEVIDMPVLGNNKLEQMLYGISVGGYLTFYLAILYGQDPSVIPWVDFFKEKLAKA
ncbi:SIS domain-containing protein [Candidatus Microgenomates bacterium]|nr:SIS domain-containing protein [Candidatus Microgenomates bacterium]MBI2622152.1 SIS domain-containing protein [Candidatus Microgenomates bacterium]